MMKIAWFETIQNAYCRVGPWEWISEKN